MSHTALSVDQFHGLFTHTNREEDLPMGDRASDVHDLNGYNLQSYQLGAMSDRVEAGAMREPHHDRQLRLGTAVWGARSKLSPYEWLAGILGDNRLSRISGWSSSSIAKFRKKHGIQFHPLRDFLPLLGLVADHDVSRASSVPVEVVTELRQYLGIYAFVAEPVEEIVIEDFHGPLLGFESLLIKMNVIDIHRETGINPNIVDRRRKHLGLPSVGLKSKLDPYRHLVNVISIPLLAKLCGITDPRVRQLIRAQERPNGQKSLPADEQCANSL